MNTTRIANQLGWRRFFQLLWNLPSFFRLFFGLIKDERVALGPKLVIISTMAYLALPTDFIPDFLLGLGQLDDFVVLFSGLKLFLRLCPPAVVQEHLRAISAGK
ncbi:MAG: YkvA family protein [Candidatus Binatia bacterium]